MQLKIGYDVSTCHVKKRSLLLDVTLVVSYDRNPILNSIVYEAEFSYGQVKYYAENVIVNNIMSQLDSEEFSKIIMEYIVEHMKDEALAVSNTGCYIVPRRSKLLLRKSTVGWKLLVHWKYGSETWVPLKKLKNTTL